MTPAHIHLLLNHVPILGVIFGLILLIAALAYKSTHLARASFVTFTVAALMTIPVYLTGDPTEEAVEHQPGVARIYIENHQDAATNAFIAVGVLGVVSLLALVLDWRRGRIPPLVTGSILVLSLVSTGLMAYTGLLGGEIRHTEVRSGATVPAPSEEGD